MATNRICNVDGCCKPAQSRGWCGKHYMRWYKHGDPKAKLNRYGESEKFLRVAVHFSEDGCLAWPFDRTPQGYGRHKRGGKRLAAHRLVCEAAHGAPPSQKHVCAHSCGNGHLGCVNPRHLRWATQRENHADKALHGTMARGERNGNASMTEDTARKAKAMIGHMTQREIAEVLGITRSAVRDIKLGKTWGWL